MAASINEKPILYFDDVSPPVRSCLMLIKMLDIDIQLEHVDLFKGEQFEAKFLELNPMHTVPTLVHGSLILTDSHVILMYLAENYEKKDLPYQLLPKQDNDRMRLLNMLFFECSVLFRHDSDMMRDIIGKGYAQTDIPYHQRKILDTYSLLEKYLNKQLFMAADNITVADLSIVSTLSTVHLVFPIDAEKQPLLSAWFERMKSIPEYDINRCGLEKLLIIMEKKGNFKYPLTI